MFCITPAQVNLRRLFSHMNRCSWVNERNPLYVKYHDEEWGEPVRDDAYLFEMLVLECFVAGLSWECVLNKRQAFREAFEGFDAVKIANYGAEKIDRLMRNPCIIRHRGKIQAAITNARVFVSIQAEFGSFADYAWKFTGGKVIRLPWQSCSSSPASDALARDLKKRGMLYTGSVTVHSWLQAVGMIQAHGPECFKA